MKEKENNMDNIFREKLKEFREEPPVYVWDNIQATLSGQRRKKRMVWYSWSAVAALLVLAFLAGWYFNDTAERTTPRVAEIERVDQQDEKAPNERKIRVPDNEPVVTGKPEYGPERLLAETTIQSKPKTGLEEKLPVSDENVREERTGTILASAELSLIKPIKTPEISTKKQELRHSLAKKDKPSVTEKSFTWEQKLMDENARQLAQTAKEQSGWKMGLNVSPGYSSYAARHAETYASNMTSETDDGNTNLSGGISVQYKTGKKVRVESGIYYAQNGQKTGSSPMFSGLRAEADYVAAPAGKLYFNTPVSMENNRMAMNSTAGIIEFKGLPKGAEIAANLESYGLYSNSLMTRGELSQVFDFVEIPLYLRYLLLDSKMDVELVGGVNAGMVVGNNVYIDNEYGVQNIGKTRDISTVNISGTIGFGLNYALGRNLSLALEPRLNYYLNSLNRNPEVAFRPYRVGIYTGLYYEF